jgi:MYXO-CTERM domain-containing protein
MTAGLTRGTLAVCAVTAGLLVSEAQAQLVFTVDIHTVNEFKATISGTFAANAIGDQMNWLAFKNDWSNNYGVMTPWLDDSLGFTSIGSAPWTVVENSIMIDGQVPAASNVSAVGNTFGDSIYWGGGFNFLAGMAVTGSIHVQGAGLFDSSIQNLELMSGYDDTPGDWARLEAVVPAPGALALLGFAGIAATRRRR